CLRSLTEPDRWSRSNWWYQTGSLEPSLSRVGAATASGGDEMGALLEISAPVLNRSARPVLSFADARPLAARYGTPLMVISRSVVADSYRALQETLPGVEFYYAAKANPHRSILSTLHKLGCSVDVCSYGEARQAVRAGFAPEAMLHTHPCKTIRNLVD